MFQGKVIIITGAASGIGKGLAEYFAGQNTKMLVLVDKDTVVNDVATALKTGGASASAHVLNVADKTAIIQLWQQVAKEQGTIDYVFNNAGYGIAEVVEEITYDQWDQMIDVNLKSVIYGSVEAFKIMKENGGGHIINTASMAGLVGFPSAAPYAATKHAVVGFSKSLRVEGAAFNIKVSCLCPAFIQTNIYGNSQTSLAPSLFKKTIPFKIISIEEAIGEIIRAVKKNERIIVFPRYAKIMYWFERFMPSKIEEKQTKAISKFRRLKEKR